MDDTKLKLTPAEVLAVPVNVADGLIRASDGHAALLYLYILRHGGELDRTAAARELSLSRQAVGLAAETLCRLGILSGGSMPRPAQELPEYEAKDVIRRTMEDPEFLDLVQMAQSTLGRVLTTADVKKLFGIYDQLAMPPEVIALLLQHCREEHEARYGAERNLGFAYIEKEAYVWHNREIVTYEQAEEWLAQKARRKSVIGQIRRELGIQNRQLSPTEQKYLGEWLELGFGPEEIVLAADRTVTNTGELRWRYANSIVQSWHKMGLHTVAEIEQGDRKPSASRRKPNSVDTPVPTKDNVKALERLELLRRKMKTSNDT